MTYGSFVSYFALDATKSRISQDHLCWVLFSNVSWFRSATEHANKRFKGLSTFYFTISTACSCSHSLGGAFWASGRETNHKMSSPHAQECRVTWTRSKCLAYKTTLLNVKSILGRVCNTHSSSENISFWI